MSVPPRWRHCPRKGKLIDAKFMPFKTPLSGEYDRQLKEEDRFHVSMLISYVEAAQQRMGMVVDLTKTDRYYDKRELLHHGIGHHKIVCEGYGAPPSDSQVKEFIQVCKHFFSSHYGEIIGIHCTHGFNRTGFLIAAYLVEEECWDLEAAVAAFSRARPPGIYKGHYLQELITRYASGEEGLGTLPVPQLPDWCLEEEEENSGGEGEGSGGGRGEVERVARQKRREINNEQARFAVVVPGVDLVTPPLREEIQHACQRILGWESGGFPACQPVSMDVQNIKLLHEYPYRVSWKADGTRYLLYIRHKGGVYLINRDNSVFSAPALCFYSRKKPGEHITETLADSELVEDKVAGGIRPRLLIYDIMQFEGSSDVSQCDHQRRLECVRRELIEPRERAAAEGLIDKNAEPFGVREKKFWDVSETRMVLERFVPQLTHENDGLIFNPTAQKYICGECKQLLKWKPEELNSVDFRLNIVKVNKPGELPKTVGQLLVGGAKQPMAELDLSANREAQRHNGRIIECCWDRSHMRWMFMRVREDKSFPNSFTTAQKVCMSIRQPVTKQWLLEVVEKHRWQPHSHSNPPHAPIKRPPPDHDDENGSLLMPPPKHRPTHHSE